MKVKGKSIDTLFSYIVILLPFLYQYKGIGNVITFGELILIPFILIYLIGSLIKTRIRNIDKPLLLFYIAAIVITILHTGQSYFSVESAGTVFLRLIYYLILVYVAREHFRWEKVRNPYFYLVFYASCYLIIQFIAYHTSGLVLPTYLKYEWQFPPEARPINFYSLGFRPSSLFLEASYYSFFVMPAICINLFTEQKSKIEIFAFISACVGIVLSTSSGGVIGVGLLFGMKLFIDRGKRSIRSLLFKLLIMFAAVVGILYIFQGQSSLLLRSRMSSGGSIGYRVSRGFIVYEELPLYHKLFGVGMGNMESYMLYNHISTMFDESNLNNCATLVQTLVYYGALGYIFFLFYLVSVVKKSKGVVGLPMSILLIYIMSYDNIMYYYRFAFLVIILDAINRSEKETLQSIGKTNTENQLRALETRR